MKSSCILWIALIVLSMIPLSLASQVGPANSAFSISRSASGSLDLHFELPAWKLEEVSKDGESLQRVSITDTPYLYIGEDETLPIFSTTLAIPYRGGASLSVLSAASDSRAVTSMDFDTLLNSEKAAGRLSDPLYPASSVLISEPMILRDFRIVTINVYPFQYDSQTRELKISQSVDLRVSFDNGPSVNEMEAPLSYSSAFESIYRGMILNYDSFRDRDTSYSSPVLLVMNGNFANAEFENRLTLYMDWKRQMGFKVYSYAVPSGSTSNTVKNYIQTAYDTWEDRPDYVVLIGDVSGNIAIPTDANYNDYNYTQLAGNDVLGDIYIGRISVSETAQFLAYTSKLFFYERDLVLSSATWMNKMLLVGDTASSGISTIYTNRYIRDMSEAVNPSYTYTEMYQNNPSYLTMNSNLAAGVEIFNFRGWMGMSNWNSESNINSINNFNRPYHAVMITCATGSFGDGLSGTETVIRAGTDSQIKGGITAIGMATTSTHTPLNNCLDMGIFHGLYRHNMRDMGTALLYSKLYLKSVYLNSGPTQYDQSIFFSKICNLMGDPTAPVYKGLPGQLTVSMPASIPSGSQSVEILVKNAALQPVPNAVVTLTNSAGLFVSGITNEQGLIAPQFPGSTLGPITVTVRKDGFKASVGQITLSSGSGFVYASHFADDGYSGISQGNGDGFVNGGEIIELWLSLRNTSSTASDVSLVASSSSPYVNILDYHLDFNIVPAGQTAESTNPLQFSVSADCPDAYSLIISLADSGGQNLCQFPLNIQIRNGKPEISSHTLIGAPGNLVYPGDQYPLQFDILNSGTGALTGLSATLRSYVPFCSVQDSLGTFGDVPAGNPGSNASDTFTINISPQALTGMLIPLELRFQNSQGFNYILSYSLTVGSVSVTDPLGQDAYGYFIYGMEDTSYMLAPTYTWIGIAPAEGGSGTLLALTDPGVSGDEGDQTNASSITTVNLPFSFKFYGTDYTRASISSNGFIAFGQTQNSDWRNWRLPGPGGPTPMLAAFWDDLCLNSGGVYTWYNASQHYYIVEWYDLTHGKDLSSRETFQAILYDPVYYPTLSGDGQIKLQYKVFNNIDDSVQGYPYPYGNFCSIGIKDQTATIGLEYAFNNSFAAAAAPLGNETALFISTAPTPQIAPSLTLGTIYVADASGNNNGLLDTGENSGLNIRIINHGLNAATGVSATLSSSDPYLTITQNYSSYGSVPGSGSAMPLTPYQVQVSASVPDGHQAVLNLNINSAQGSWNREFHLTLNAPLFEFGTMSILDPSGNNNGVLDPGETVTLRIVLANNGGAESSSGTASVSSPTPGISIINGSTSFTAVGSSSTTLLSYTVAASSSLSEGTLATLSFHAGAGNYSADENRYVEVGMPLLVSIGNGTSVQSYPIDRYYNYSVHESIYLASEIGGSGLLKSIGFYKGSGTDVSAIQSVTIYMKHTTATSLSSGNYSTTGYTQVYNGDFPNTATSGWMEVNLNPMFTYSADQNLSILIVKNFQQYINNYPQWRYTTTTGYRARQERSDSAMPTSLSASASLPNLQIRMFPVQEVLYPPQNLTAQATHQRIDLGWSAPVSGTPVSYKLYRNSSLLTTVTALSYTDLAVTNGTSYSYYVTALYSNPTGESEPSNSVDVTPTTIEFVIIGTGTSVSTNGQNSPINISNNSTHGQLVYTAAELNAAGVTGPVLISGLGFYVVTSPDLALPNFMVRMKHTTAVDGSSWHDANGFVTVYSNASYMPSAGGWDMLMFSAPFEWNGEDNLVVDTAFGVVAQASQTGTMQYTTIANGYRFAWSNTTNQSNIFTGGLAVNRRYNVRLILQDIPSGPSIEVEPATIPFGNVPVNTSSIQQFSIENTGDTV
ncbi:MAG TPA: C25 family cysteine peptidase, partial [Candidatus Cloacimonadota bacterium]|nr:C25 family cysteine peptidase [Candidatus Cloacimonadota bacterium]